MHKIWLATAAALALICTSLAAPPAHADAVPHQVPGDRVLGKADAPITIFEYFSLTCPHCAAFEKEVYPKLKKEWIDTGKAKIIYRDYPLDRNALKAAMVARCAPPDRYAEFVAALFEQQAVWGPEADPTESLKPLALLGGISSAQFDKCMSDKALAESIVAEEDQADKEYGVNSTPTFFINGTKIVGAMSYDDFVKQLEKAQAAAVPAHVQSAQSASH